MIGTILVALATGGLTVAAMRWATRAERQAADLRAANLDAQEWRVNETWDQANALFAQAAQTLDEAYRINGENDWMRQRQAAYHVELCRWRDRLMSWWRDMNTTYGPEPVDHVMSVDELRSVSDQLLAEAGVAEHLVAIYGGQPGHFVSDAMPEQLHAVVDHAQHAPTLHKVLTQALGIEEDEPEATYPTPTTDTDVPVQPSPEMTQSVPVDVPPSPTPSSPPKVDPVLIGLSVRKLMREQDERALADLVRRGEIRMPVGASA